MSGCCARPTATAPPHPGEHLLKPVRQLVESIFDTLKGQLDLELPGGRSIDGVSVRIGQTGTCGTKGAVYAVSATGFTGELGPTAILVVVAGTGFDRAVPEPEIRQILTTLRPEKA